MRTGSCFVSSMSSYLTYLLFTLPEKPSTTLYLVLVVESIDDILPYGEESFCPYKGPHIFSRNSIRPGNSISSISVPVF